MKQRRIFCEILAKKVVEFLRKKQEPQLTLTIAKACGVATAKQVNPTIYELERRGFVRKCNEIPPFWQLLNISVLPKTIESSFNFPNIKKSTSPSETAHARQCSWQFSNQDQTLDMDDFADIDLFRKSSEDTAAPGAYNVTTNVSDFLHIKMLKIISLLIVNK